MRKILCKLFGHNSIVFRHPLVGLVAVCERCGHETFVAGIIQRHWDFITSYPENFDRFKP
jgi:hypothetical protein